ncbi:MAG: UDP-N-acetylglucosamine 2-epimerase (non-hydrolyzing), partial [Clostridia bacterium]|nr:UDP-N-acetylglucosamine 2-epimerase (non-hydrolyzing) [Clostridia bacterium]
VIDALKHTVKPDYVFADKTLQTLDYENKRVILVTAHRRENLGEPLENICRAILNIVNSAEDVEVVYPIHMNPLVRNTANKILGGHNRIHIIEPLDVTELHNLMSRCYMVMTDSGGLQEEAPSLAKPVLVLRDKTERPEAITAGTVKIAGVEEALIIEMAKELLFNKEEYEKMSKAVNPYGDGLASERIADAILYTFGVKSKAPSNFND